MHEHVDHIATPTSSTPRHARRFAATLAACVAVGGLAAGIAGATSGGEPEARGRLAEGEAPRGQDGPGDAGASASTSVPAGAESTTSTAPGVPTTAAPATTVPAGGSPATTVPPATQPAPAAQSVAVPGVGIVTIAAGPRLVDVTPAAGVTFRVESSAREVHVRFATPSGRVDVQAEMEDGQLRIRVRDRRAGSPATSPTVPRGGTATTVPDASDDRGHGSDDGADHDADDDHGGDRSGSGSDDRSGHDDGDDHGSGGHGSDD